jgi:hypothetical protein
MAEHVADQWIVAAAMAALRLPDLDAISGLADRIDPDVGAVVLEGAGNRSVGVDVDGLFALVFETSLGSVEDHHGPLPWHERIEGVGHLGAAGIVHDQVHTVLDVDLGTEDAAGTKIPVW